MTTRLLLICGSLRTGSVNAAVLRTVAALARDDVAVETYEGMETLPYFDPDADHDPLPPTVASLRTSIAAADAVLFCTPEYAGALPGSFKNLLDWTVGGGEMYRKPVAWINASAAPAGAVNAHASLRTVLGYLSTAIVEAACVSIPVPRASIGDDGLIHHAAIRLEIAAAVAALAQSS
ncbi:MAG: NAD(P)H-dependent oxidoreductase [Gemmatimonadota bacterium]|nr:NAD(P)H-dependent oxidoreductase [Gemmatimonadota bacterium]